VSSSRTTARRQAAAAAAAQRAAAARRRRVAIISAAVVVALVALTVLVIALRQGENEPAGDEPAGDQPAAATPSNLQDGAIVAGDGPVNVTLYEDMQCPACRQFEASIGPTLEELVEGGEITLERRLLAFLDRASTDRYSSRAANAVACVVDDSPDAAGPYLATLFARQPVEGGAGLSDDELAGLAEDSGAADVGECIAEERFGGWVRTVTEEGLDEITGTPTLLVDGEQLQELTPDAVRAAVEEAGS
jgi:protein-disulfide isomerase